MSGYLIVQLVEVLAGTRSWSLHVSRKQPPIHYDMLDPKQMTFSASLSHVYRTIAKYKHVCIAKLNNTLLHIAPLQILRIPNLLAVKPLLPRIQLIQHGFQVIR
jgi:hypothetical protein